MKILVICQYYFPEPLRVSDVCEELVKRGHEVTVVTGLPNYPMGKIYDGYRHGKKRDEVQNGVKIHRCFTVGRRTGAVWRMLNYYSYMLSSTAYVSGLPDDFDVVFVYQLSPVMMANAGIKYAKKHHKKLVLYCLDLWPTSLEVSDIRPDSLIYQYFKSVSKKIYNKTDCLFVSSQMFIPYLTDYLNVSTEKIKYLPQYAEDIFLDADLSKKPNEYYDFGFAGNIGKLQSVQTIIEAAKIMKGEKNVRFHIAGDGISLEECKARADGLDNIRFYGRLDIKEMPQFYKKMDAMIVTMISNDSVNTVMPGKVQTYMAAGKPVIGSIGGETKLIVGQAKCGFCSAPENAEALCDVIHKFILSNEKEKLGSNSKEFYRNHFTKEIFIESLISELNQGATND